jgi:peptidoglycan/LPS O-acetylase OafA/YrhL
MASTSTALSDQALRYRPGIDGIRAIAVLGVVLYHAGIGPPGGFAGVDVFFVISGFLITSLLEIELRATGRIDIAAFYARRARRLLPALGIMLTATVAASFFVLSYGELKAALQSAAASFVFGANIFFQYTTGDYFGPDVNRLPLLHLWSLGVEEQYYLVWPIALWLSHRLPLSGRRPIFLAGVLASLAFAEWALYQGSQAAFYAMPSRWWELSFGALVAWSPGPDRRASRWASWAGLAFIGVAMASPTHHFPGMGALPATVGAGLLLHASTSTEGIWRLLSSRPMVLIGRISYPLYLWHWPLLALTSAVWPGQIDVAGRGALVLTALALAAATWRWLERPVQRIPMSSPRRLVGATLVASMAIAILATQLANITAASPPPHDPGVAAEQDTPTNFRLCNNRMTTPAVLPDEAVCALGGTAPPRVAIWGDSHAMAFQPFAIAIAHRTGKTAIAYSRDACTPTVDQYSGQSPLFISRCKEFDELALRRAETMDTVILSARWPSTPTADFTVSFTAMIGQLSGHVSHVIIIGPTPDLPASVPDCLRRASPHACEVTRDAFVTKSAAIRRLLSSFPARHTNVAYVEPLDFFCDQTVCPGVRDGMPLYWDDNHISWTAATAFAEQFLAERPKRERLTPP